MDNPRQKIHQPAMQLLATGNRSFVVASLIAFPSPLAHVVQRVCLSSPLFVCSPLCPRDWHLAIDKLFPLKWCDDESYLRKESRISVSLPGFCIIHLNFQKRLITNRIMWTQKMQKNMIFSTGVDISKGKVWVGIYQ